MPMPSCNRPPSPADSSRTSQASPTSLSADHEMGRSTIGAFEEDIKRLGGTDVGSAYTPLVTKDYTPYIGPIRVGRPDVIMTATAGNDTVPLLTPLKEYRLLSGKLTLAGAAGAVTQEN